MARSKQNEWMDGDLDNGKGSVIETEGRSGGALLVLPLLEEAWVAALGGAGLSCRPGLIGMDEYLHLCSCVRACICCICGFVLVITFVFSIHICIPEGWSHRADQAKWGENLRNNITNTHSLNLRNNTSCITQPNPPKITKASTNLEGAMAFMMAKEWFDFHP